MKAHRTDNLSLFFGLLFLLVAGGYLLQRQLDLELPAVGWFIAAGIIFLGMVMAVTALVPDRQPKQPDLEQQAEQAEIDEEVDEEAEVAEKP
ncbi:MAG TPA: hypothetical protein DGT23_01440 [Micromonosporaceae bacterium]|nr:hypothetical protein [Micromonosporaceae bacterium]